MPTPRMNAGSLTLPLGLFLTSRENKQSGTV
jgi:hypothetical protein